MCPFPLLQLHVCDLALLLGLGTRLRLKHTDNPSTMLNEASRLQLFGLETVQPRYLQHGRLDEAEQQVFASCQRVNLQNRKQLRDWLQDRSKLWKLMFF